MRKDNWLGALVFALVLALGSAHPAAANIIPCEYCTCGHSCTRSCDVGDTCGNYGVCESSPACTSCLTTGEAEQFLALMRGLQNPVTSSEEHGEIAARLTWRLAQHVEELALGTVFAGGTRFHLPGRAQASALAFTRAGAPKGTQVPDLTVEFMTKSDHGAAIAGWLSAGVKVVLAVNPSTRSITVYQGREVKTLTETDYLELPDLLPGWSLRVGELFN